MSRTFEEMRDSGGKISDVPSFLEARDPSITNPYMRRRPPYGTNLTDLFEDSDVSDRPKIQCIEVYLRIKPINEEVMDIYQLLDATTLQTAVSSKQKKLYKFTEIFEATASQKQMFERVVKKNIGKLLEGDNYTLLTYGPSGSGKTFTLTGTEEKPGLLPRSLELLFQLIKSTDSPRYKPKDGCGVEYLSPQQQVYEKQMQNKMRQIQTNATSQYSRMSVRLSGDFNSRKPVASVWVSYAEIYNETITDLLEPHGRNDTAKKLLIVDDSKGNPCIKGLKKVYIQSGLEAFQVMSYGKKNLKYAKTKINVHSSRSHSIFTITIVRHWPDGSPIISTLRLCDLAGSERNKKTCNQGKRLQESCAINMSLHVLERCLERLRVKQNSTNSLMTTHSVINSSQAGNIVVPFRESKLTRILSGALSGRENAAMVVNINPERSFFEETQHVLQFSAIARKLVVQTQLDSGRSSPSISSSSSHNMMVMTDELLLLRQENEALREEIARVSIEANTLADQREREVRNEMAIGMKKLLEKSNDGWEKQTAKEQAILRDEFASEVEEIEDRYNKIIKELNDKIKEMSVSVKTERISILPKNISIKKEIIRPSYSPEKDLVTAQLKATISSLQKDLNQALTRLAICKDENNTLMMQLQRMQTTFGDLNERYIDLEESTCISPVQEAATTLSSIEDSTRSYNDDGDIESENDAMMYNSDSEDEVNQRSLQTHTIKKQPKRISLDRSGIVMPDFDKRIEESIEIREESQKREEPIEIREEIQKPEEPIKIREEIQKPEESIEIREELQEPQESAENQIVALEEIPSEAQAEAKSDSCLEEVSERADSIDSLSHIKSYCEQLYRSCKDNSDKQKRRFFNSDEDQSPNVRTDKGVLENQGDISQKTEGNESIDRSTALTDMTNSLISASDKPVLDFTMTETSQDSVQANDSLERDFVKPKAKQGRKPKSALAAQENQPISDIPTEIAFSTRRITRKTIAMLGNQNTEGEEMTNTGRRKLFNQRCKNALDLCDRDRSIGGSPDLPMEPLNVPRPSFTPRPRRKRNN